MRGSAAAGARCPGDRPEVVSVFGLDGVVGAVGVGLERPDAVLVVADEQAPLGHPRSVGLVGLAVGRGERDEVAGQRLHSVQGGAQPESIGPRWLDAEPPLALQHPPVGQLEEGRGAVAGGGQGVPHSLPLEHHMGERPLPLPGPVGPDGWLVQVPPEGLPGLAVAAVHGLLPGGELDHGALGQLADHLEPPLARLEIGRFHLALVPPTLLHTAGWTYFLFFIAAEPLAGAP